MSSVMESTQLTFDWDYGGEVESKTEGNGQRWREEAETDSGKAIGQASLVSTGDTRSVSAANRFETITSPKVKQSRAVHIGGLMLQVLARYGITQDEFLDEYNRQMQANNR